MSVLSVTRQLASTQPPPMPIQSDEDSAWPFVCCVEVGTVQSPAISWKSLRPFSIVPCLQPNQFELWLALSLSRSRRELSGDVAAGAEAVVRASVTAAV